MGLRLGETASEGGTLMVAKLPKGWAGEEPVRPGRCFRCHRLAARGIDSGASA